MIRLHLSRRWIGRLGVGLAVGAFLLGCYELGDVLTPRGREGRPLVLSPTVRAVALYRRAALSWLAELEAVDEGLAGVLDRERLTDPAQLYATGEAVQALSSRAASVARDVLFTPSPPAMVGLGEQARAAAEAYLQLATAAARWVGAPNEESRLTALEALKQARLYRSALEGSQWLKGADDVEASAQ